MIDPESAVWKAVKDWADAEQRKILSDLAAPGTNFEDTLLLRGRYQQLKFLARLPEGKAEPKAMPVQPYIT